MIIFGAVIISGAYELDCTASGTCSIRDCSSSSSSASSSISGKKRDVFATAADNATTGCGTAVAASAIVSFEETATTVIDLASTHEYHDWLIGGPYMMASHVDRKDLGITLGYFVQTDTGTERSYRVRFSTNTSSVFKTQMFVSCKARRDCDKTGDEALSQLEVEAVSFLFPVEVTNFVVEIWQNEMSGLSWGTWQSVSVDVNLAPIFAPQIAYDGLLQLFEAAHGLVSESAVAVYANDYGWCSRRHLFAQQLYFSKPLSYMEDNEGSDGENGCAWQLANVSKAGIVDPQPPATSLAGVAYLGVSGGPGEPVSESETFSTFLRSWPALVRSQATKYCPISGDTAGASECDACATGLAQAAASVAASSLAVQTSCESSELSLFNQCATNCEAQKASNLLSGSVVILASLVIIAANIILVRREMQGLKQDVEQEMTPMTAFDKTPSPPLPADGVVAISSPRAQRSAKSKNPRVKSPRNVEIE